MRLIVPLTCLLFLAGCSRQQNSNPPPKPKTTALAEKEELAEVEALTPAGRAAARQAATDFVREHLPKWTIKGLHAEQYNSGAYRISVDIVRGARREVLDLAAQQFFPEEGEPYWKASLLTDTVRDALHDSADYDMLKRLNEATNDPEPADEP